MKLSLNLLPPKPEEETSTKTKKSVVSLTVLVLVIFLLINFGIFGFYWFVIKNTADTLQEIKRREEAIKTFAPKENLYRQFLAKTEFISDLWQKKAKVEEVIKFSQNLLIPGVTLTKLSLKEESLATLNLSVINSDTLENLLSVVSEKQERGEIKDLKALSTERSKETNAGYNFVLSFKFLGEKPSQ